MGSHRGTTGLAAVTRLPCADVTQPAATPPDDGLIYVAVSPAQLPIVQDFLKTGDTPLRIAERLGVSRNLVSQQLLRVARSGGFETATQLMAALANRRARLVPRTPRPRGRWATREIASE